METMKALVIKLGDFPLTKEFNSFKDMQKEIGITRNEDWETMLLNENDDSFKGIGIMARDQDKKLKKNALGMKGTFIICGYTRTESEGGTAHSFTGLTDEQIALVNKRFIRTLMFNPATLMG